MGGLKTDLLARNLTDNSDAAPNYKNICSVHTEILCLNFKHHIETDIITNTALIQTKGLHDDLNKSKKGLPLETKNIQNHENRRLGLIESLHMQHCSLQGCIRPLAPA